MPRKGAYKPQKKIHWPSENREDRVRWRRFFAELSATGAIRESGVTCKIGKDKIKRLRETFEDFEQKIQDAQDQYVENMETEADRRGMEGVDDPVFFQGEIVGHRKKYSDDLLKFRLRGLRPEKYREGVAHTGPAIGGPIINIYLPDNKREDKPAIILDAPYTEVLSPPDIEE